MGKTLSSIAHLLTAVSMFACVSQVSASKQADRTNAALRQLHNATSNQRSGQHLLNLSALRSLRDTNLRPFFSQFTQHPDWTVQVHAVLGIAELSEEQSIDPWLVQQIAPTAREHLIAQALDDGLIKKEQMQALLKWPQLEDAPKLLLLTDLHAMGGDDAVVDQAIVRDLAKSTDLTVAMFAALLSKNQESIDRTTKYLRRATSTNRDNALLRTTQLIRQYNFKSASPWLVSLLEDGSVALTPNQRYWTLYTLLTVDSASGLEIWNREVATEPTRIDQVRYLMIVLEAGITPTVEMRERLHIDLSDQLLGNLFMAGLLNGLKEKATEEDIASLTALAQQGHRASTDWAFRLAEEVLTEEQALPFYETLSTVEEQATGRRKEVAIRAFTRLIELAPESAWVILEDAKDDSEQQELLLLAMLQLADDDAIEQATKLRRIGVNKADVLALLLIARSSSPLQKNDQEYLGIIAAGGGHLGPALETQAAWLYLKRMGLADKALAAVSTP
ncbi:MAG: hypothetical protein CMJ26_01285 [Phycisphaerae bacterium]|nr:hypothetical protein [Phycisphaerae bacterium]